MPAKPGITRFAYLASAIAGRRVDVAAGARHGLAWTDGATIFVDSDAAEAEQIRSIAVQACLLGAGSLDADVLDLLGSRPVTVRRYLAVESHRALASLVPVLPPSVTLVVDRELAGRSDSPASSLAVAKSRIDIEDPPSVFGMIKPRQVRRELLTSTQVQATGDHVPRSDARDMLRDLEDDEPEAAPQSDIVSSPVGGGGAIGRLLKRFLGDARSAGSGSPGAEVPTHRGNSARRPEGLGVVTSTATAPITPRDDMPRATGLSYPEWDVRRRRYRLGWCVVSEVEPERSQPTRFALPHVQAYRRPLARLGTSLERRSRQLQGIDIDIDAGVEAYVGTIAGSAPVDAVYVDLVPRRRDLAALVLLDVSGSAGEPSAAGGTVHEHQRAAAGALTLALHELGDRVALYAFRSHGRSAVSVVPLKRFGEVFDARVEHRLGACVPGAYTRLGAAIRHATTVLERDAGTSRRLLIVLSDGFAYDHGYEGTYGEADARRALAEARRRGMGCVCVSLGAAMDVAALRRVFGTAAHARVARVDDLPRVIGPLLQFGLRSAEAQQRSYQRKTRARERLDAERLTA